ncbi:MAG: DUF4297 domain-containing protein [Coprobacillus sp.]|nr:DUF4297 domain-containing protein [Coprobacillus sp.]
MENLYQKLPFDLSGSRSKNRFRNEILWGLEKIFEVYKTGRDFRMVFDYVCDLELHMDSAFEFYQIKTCSGGTPYTITKIAKPDKVGKSIYGKVYLLKNIANEEESAVKTKVAIVVNTPLKGMNKKIYNSIGELELTKLDEKSKQYISNNIKKELELDSDVVLKDTYYIYTSMDLFNPQNSLLGQTVNFFVELTGKEPIKVKALYRLLVDTITLKSNYELECKEYKEVIEKKGITRTEFDNMIQKHIDISDAAVVGAKALIDDTYPLFSDRVKIKNALTQIVQDLILNKALRKTQDQIIQYISQHLEEFDKTIAENVKFLVKHFGSLFSIEYSIYDKQALCILILAKFQEGLL